MAADRNSGLSGGSGLAPRPPLDPCQRHMRFGPIRPMNDQPSLLHRLLFG